MSLPFISLILPIRNEGSYIERCLQAILAQDYQGQIEIIIVDGMSTDQTRKIIEQTARHSSFSICLLDNHGKIVPTGMNIALRQAKGDIIVRVDGHCLIVSDYVRKCVEHIQLDGVDGVGGPMKTIGETPLASVVALAMSSPFGVGNSAFRTLSDVSMLADTVPFPAYTREIIKRAGFYDEELVRNQDDEYNYRIRSLGGKILLANDVRSVYFSRASLGGLWRQYFQYGIYKVRVLQKHPRQMSLRQFVPPVFVLSLFVSLILGFFPSVYFLSFFIPIAYVFANLAASFLTLYASNKTNQLKMGNHLLFLPLAFLFLHLSYGLGFLLGILKFWNRWSDKAGRTPPGELFIHNG